jgi:hypothetical protein
MTKVQHMIDTCRTTGRAREKIRFWLDVFLGENPTKEFLFSNFHWKTNPLFWFCLKKIDFYRYFIELSCGAFLLCIAFVYSFCV